ncbi:MAG: PEP-CTERM sorting domain-containing protein [Deltaproteobacteria bacterium]|nr:PEP-CTERM sorting domain-containing protein [Deltaproteobacteria bacterium]
MSRLFLVALVSLVTGVAGSAGALQLTVEQSFPLNGAPGDAEDIAVIYDGANAGIYIPHDSQGLVTVLDVNTGAFLYNFSFNFGTFPHTEFRAMDVLPNGNLIIGQHDVNYVREFVIPGNPGDGSVPIATPGTINFALPNHPDHPDLNQAFDEFEAITAFARPSDGQVFLLIGEEGRTPTGQSTEAPGEVYLAQVSGSGITGFTKLFDVPLADNFDDLSGLDVINMVFDGAGNIDLANSTVIMTDDSSGSDSSAFVLNLLGQILESLDGPGAGITANFESEFGQPWRDAEGVDYDAATGKITVFFSDGASGTPAIVRFDSVLEAPPAPEPALLGLLGAGLGALALRRARSSRL